MGFTAPSNVTLAAGTTMYIPLNSTDSGETVSYAVTASDYSKLTPTMTPSTNKTVQFNLDINGVTEAMDFQLFDNLCALTTAKIEQLVNSGYYNGLQIYRNGTDGNNNPFVLQGGNDPPDPSNHQTSPIKADQSPIAEEFNPDLQYTSAGILAMARTSPANSSSSEFFIMEEPYRYLDFNYSIFGFETDGDSVVNTISQSQTHDDQQPRPNGKLGLSGNAGDNRLGLDIYGHAERRAGTQGALGSDRHGHGHGDRQRRDQYAHRALLHGHDPARCRREPPQPLCLVSRRRRPA